MAEQDGFLKPVRQGVGKAKKLIEGGTRARDGRVKQSSRIASALLIAAVLVFWGFGVWFYVLLNNLS